MLFKYCSFARAIDILRTERIRLTQPSDFNDPFEIHPEFQLMSKEDIAELPLALDEEGNAIPGTHQLTPAALERIFSAILPQLAKMAPDQQQTPGAMFAIDNNTVGRSYYDANFGVLSLTETPDNLLMWSHYGDSHKGVVLGFDESHPFFQGDEVVSGLSRLNKVEYSQKRPILSISTQNNPKVFLRKSVDWSYEREWRLIRPLTEAASMISREGLSPLCLFEIPHGAIKTVVTGSQITPNEYREICDYCAMTPSLAHVQVRHILLSKEQYELEVHPALTEEEHTKRMNGRTVSAKNFDV